MHTDGRGAAPRTHLTDRRENFHTAARRRSLSCTHSQRLKTIKFFLVAAREEGRNCRLRDTVQKSTNICGSHFSLYYARPRMSAKCDIRHDAQLTKIPLLHLIAGGRREMIIKGLGLMMSKEIHRVRVILI